MALKEINREPVDYINLYSEVMAMASDGYSEDMPLTICVKIRRQLGDF